MSILQDDPDEAGVAVFALVQRSVSPFNLRHHEGHRGERAQNPRRLFSRDHLLLLQQLPAQRTNVPDMPHELLRAVLERRNWQGKDCELPQQKL